MEISVKLSTSIFTYITNLLVIIVVLVTFILPLISDDR